MKTILEDKKKDAIKKLVQLVPLPEHVESVIIKPMLSRYTNTNTNLRNGFIFCPFHSEVNEPSFHGIRILHTALVVWVEM